MYMKVQVEPWVPRLEKEVEEARRKLVELLKECNALTTQAKKVTQLEVNSVALQCNVHQVEVERQHNAYSAELELKDSFYEVEKVHMLVKLQASYNSKLLGLYDE